MSDVSAKDFAAADLLATYASASLQQMAKQRGLATKSTAKAALVTGLARDLFDPARVQRALADLAANERYLLDQVILAGGQATTSILRKRLEYEKIVDPTTRDPLRYYQEPTGSAHAKGSRKFEDIVARLGLLGLLFCEQSRPGASNTVDLTKPTRRLFIPAAILLRLPVPSIPVERVAEPRVVRLADPGRLLRDLYSLLSLATREKIPLTTRGLIPKKNAARINGLLREPEEMGDARSEDDLIWLPFLRGLAQTLNLIAPSIGELVADPKAGDFLKRPAAERQRRLYDAYLQTPHWFEVFRLPEMGLRAQGVSLRHAPPAGIAARRRVVAALAKMPAGEWIPVDHLVERLRATDYEFLLSRQIDPSTYYYSSWGYDASPNVYTYNNPLGVVFEVYRDEYENWTRVEGEFVWIVVSEAMHALGVVDLGGDERSIQAFRITANGARLLRGEPLPAAASKPNVVVQPNFQIFAFDPTGEDVLFTLDQFADRKSAQQATEYEVSRESIYRAQKSGMTVADVIAFLDAVSTTGIPQNVRRSLDDWGGQLERITVRRGAAVLTAVDAATLDALYADPAIAPLLGRRVAPTAAIVRQASADDLRALSDRLIASGRLPATTEGSDARSARGPRVTVDAGGKIAFRHRQPSIFDISRLRSLADERDGKLTLTPASLRQAAKEKRTADEIVATLEELAGGAVAPEVAALVRRWAKDWGRGALFQTALLQVDDAAALADLLADPEVKPLVQPVAGAPTIAVVCPDAVKKLRALLEARGMSLDDKPLR